MKRILALTDLSTGSETALAWARALAARWDARVFVANVETRRSDLVAFGAADPENTRKLVEWARENDRRELERLAKRYVPQERLEAFAVTEADSVRAGVSDLIERRKPDLVVMTTHGRSGLPHVVLGSVTEYTIRTSRAPVLAVKPDTPPPADGALRVVAGIDFSDGWEAFAKGVAALLGPEDELVLVHAIESVYWAPPPYTHITLPQPDVPALREASLEALRALDVKGPRLHYAAEAGRPVDVLLDAQAKWKAPVAAVRTHGRRGFDRLMLGSVAERFVRKADGAVLVYPAPASA